MIENRDYTLIIDKSGSMATQDQSGGRSRWHAARESTLALASKCEQLDPDGITVYVFAGRFRRYENVTTAKVDQVFRENDPSGSTDLAGVLRHAFDAHFARRKMDPKAWKPETILVVTDGEPDDPKAVMRTIIDASRQVQNDEDLAVSLIQVGTDPHATRFLKMLDDDLVGAGAKFDLCDTITMHEVEDTPLADVLVRAITD